MVEVGGEIPTIDEMGHQNCGKNGGKLVVDGWRLKDFKKTFEEETVKGP